MLPQRFVLVAAIVFTAAAPMCSQSQWRRVSSFQFEWDGHPNVQVALEIPKTWTDPGDFTRIRIRVPGQREFVLGNKYGWVKYRSQEAATSPKVNKWKNLIPSEFLLALTARENNRTMLFLLGYSYSSSPGSLDVLEISATGQPRVVLHRLEFGLLDVRDLDSDGIAEIIGFPCLSQEFGNGLLTYDPLNVYKLGSIPGEVAKLSIPLTKSYNLEHYYGWAGSQCSENFAVVLHPSNGGKPQVMSTREAERITEGKKP